MIIGMDNASLLLPMETRTGGPGSKGPIAFRTALGWALGGHVGVGSDNVIANYSRVTSYHVDGVNALSLDAANDMEVTGMSQEDEKVIKMWDDTCELRSDNHFYLPVPWRKNQCEFPDNYGYVAKRLNMQMKKLDRLGKTDEYTAGVQKFIERDYAEEVPEDEKQLRGGKVNYLPHHGTSSESKPKLRVVFDCRAEYCKVSINNQALQGPDLVNKLDLFSG